MLVGGHELGELVLGKLMTADCVTPPPTDDDAVVVAGAKVRPVTLLGAGAAVACADCALVGEGAALLLLPLEFELAVDGSAVPRLKCPCAGVVARRLLSLCGWLQLALRSALPSRTSLSHSHYTAATGQTNNQHTYTYQHCLSNIAVLIFDTAAYFDRSHLCLSGKCSLRPLICASLRQLALRCAANS